MFDQTKLYLKEPNVILFFNLSPISTFVHGIKNTILLALENIYLDFLKSLYFTLLSNQ